MKGVNCSVTELFFFCHKREESRLCAPSKFPLLSSSLPSNITNRVDPWLSEKRKKKSKTWKLKGHCELRSILFCTTVGNPLMETSFIFHQYLYLKEKHEFCFEPSLWKKLREFFRGGQGEISQDPSTKPQTNCSPSLRSLLTIKLHLRNMSDWFVLY